MKVTMLLADSAQVVEGKLYVLGGGWSITGPEPSPFAIALLFDVPWDQTNIRHHFRLELVDLDGHPVLVETPEGEQGLAIEGQFEIGRPPGLKRGAAIPTPLAFNLPPQPIPPGGWYEWRLTVDDSTDEDWRLPFSTRPADAA
jgi:hypothetical protein